MQVAYGAMYAYARIFLLPLLAGPIMGIIILLAWKGAPDVVKIMGLFLLFWPASLPARAVVVTSGLRKRLAKPHKVEWDDAQIQFVGQDKTGARLGTKDILKTYRFMGMYLIVTKKLGVAPVPMNVFDDSSKESFEDVVRLRQPSAGA